MVLMRIKIAAALLLALSVAGFGAGLLAQASPDAAVVRPSNLPGAIAAEPEPPAPKPASARQAAERKPEKKSAGGRVFAEVVFPPGLVGLFADSNPSKVVAIDPETGKWTTVSEPGGIVRVSPDVRFVAFLRGNELWRADVRGLQKPVRLAEKAGRVAWSPDGKQLVHSPGEVVADGGWKCETWRLNADGSGTTRLNVPDTDSVDDWSPDGKWFVTCSDRHPPRGSGYQLYRMHPDGTGQERLTQGRGLNCYARFSPDGRRILYLHQERAVNSLHVMDADGKNNRVLVPEKQRERPQYACWSPDGKRVAVLIVIQPRPGAKDLVGRPRSDSYRLEILDADGRNRRPLHLPDRDGDPIPLVGVGHLDWR
jgi:dipeptidyl aminopeptidase/acylaminoacyl peptidase